MECWWKTWNIFPTKYISFYFIFVFFLFISFELNCAYLRVHMLKWLYIMMTVPDVFHITYSWSLGIHLYVFFFFFRLKRPTVCYLFYFWKNWGKTDFLHWKRINSPVYGTKTNKQQKKNVINFSWEFSSYFYFGWLNETCVPYIIFT